MTYKVSGIRYQVSGMLPAGRELAALGSGSGSGYPVPGTWYHFRELVIE